MIKIVPILNLKNACQAFMEKNPTLDRVTLKNGMSLKNMQPSKPLVLQQSGNLSICHNGFRKGFKIS